MALTVDEIIEKQQKWHDEFVLLRKIILDCGLVEEIKWRWPCYTYKNDNIVLIHGFKDYCAVLFFKGSLIQDAEGILSRSSENMQSARQMRFTNVNEIVALEKTLKAYIFEAIEIEKAGLKVELKKHEDYPMVQELQTILDARPELKTAYENLTPGRQRGYLLHFAAAKQDKTRVARIEAVIPRILKCKGLLDCVCGHTKKKPNCDGSHKFIN